MLIQKVIDVKFLKIILAALLSYYFGLMFLRYNVQVVALFLVAAFVILFFRKIEYAFYFILVSRPFLDIFYNLSGGAVRIGQLAGGGLTLLFVIYLVFYIFHVYRFNIFSLGINKILGCFLFFSFISIFFSKSIGVGISSWLKLFQAFILLNITILIVISTGSELFKKKGNLICWSVIAALLYPLIKFYINFFTGHGRELTGYVRYSTFGVNHNVFSYILLIAFPFCLFLYSVSTSKAGKKIWLTFLGVMSYTIYISYTRNVWIGLAVLLLAWIIVNKKYMLCYIFVCLLVTIFLLNPDVQKRLTDVYLVFSGGSFFDIAPLLLSGRIGIWQKNIHYFIDESTLIEKLFGSGYDVYLQIGGYRSGRSGAEHSNYMTLLMNTGIFGLSFYLFYIVKLFQESFRLLKKTTDVYLRSLAQVFISVLVSYVIIGLASHILWMLTFQYYFSVFAGLVIAGNILEKNNDEKKSELDSSGHGE